MLAEMLKRENWFAVALFIAGVTFCVNSSIVIYVLVKEFEPPFADQAVKADIVSIIERVETGELVLTQSDQAYRMRGFLMALEGSDEMIGGLLTTLQFMSLLVFIGGLALLFLAFYVRAQTKKSRLTVFGKM